jgi:nanoRNase/pAp phosphatase (c-di-AMP/oligoRNAs hydrolase)
MCGRAENRAMMDLLHIVAQHLTLGDLDRFRTICLVDTQPRSGNNLFTGPQPADVVIDHHLLPKRRRWTAAFADIRPDYGAASTILFEYCEAAGTSLGADLATALFYGIQSDTQDLGRDTSAADARAYQRLFSLADKGKLAQTRRAPVPSEYFQMLHDGLTDCVVAGSLVLSCVRPCENPDMIAEVADLLMRLAGIRVAVCYGAYRDRVYVSARAVDARANAARRIRQVVRGIGFGGGHRTIAGGQIPVTEDQDLDALLAHVRARILRAFAPNRPLFPLFTSHLHSAL